ncbi:MAG: UDP-N-acetylmuramate dehydrogenase [Deltaproteobacteria bacterium]|nr:UDP-N-acetylmuramate dehydrogenase [Deltaproteobacteria bacterium]
MVRGVSLSEHTSLGLGGEAEAYITVREVAELKAALRYAERRGMPVLLLGGGSNLVVADGGFAGLVIALGMRGVELQREGDVALLTARAGESWDAVVEYSVGEGLAGLECLSGIPGLAGATPVQNVGAYGQEVSQRLRQVDVLDRANLERRCMTPEACEFGYRDSLFKREPERFVVLSVTFALTPGGAPSLRYAPLRDAFTDQTPSLSRVREQVLRLRRAKSMLLDPSDPNSRSAGSFFTNPIVDRTTLNEVLRRAVEAGVIESVDEMPHYALDDGRIKLAAGWLIERAGVAKGTRRGAVGVSAHHALALVHHGGGRTADLLALARDVRAKVRERFGVELLPEPVMVGFERAPL